MENHHAINGYINYFEWVIFNSYVILPEGKTTINHHPVITIFIGGMFTISSHGW